MGGEPNPRCVAVDTPCRRLGALLGSQPDTAAHNWPLLSSKPITAGGEGLPTANVVDFGARGDDDKDDALAINKAITSLRGTGGILLFPSSQVAGRNFTYIS